MHRPYQIHSSTIFSKKTSQILLLFCAAFLLGSAAGNIYRQFSTSSESDQENEPASVLALASENWGLSFPTEGERPVGNASIEELGAYNAWYAQNTTEPVIYLTFDCGYENGNTAAILDALKKHQASATFFVTGTFIKDQPELIKRMVSEGHTVGNHTLTHPDMSNIAAMEDFKKELDGVSSVYEEITGEPMTKFYRPPRGVYNTSNLSMAKELGYHTFFWSLAYVDWLQDQQPTKEEAYGKLLPRIHPGAIVLLHNTSSTNASILDELLTKWEEMGYHFDTLKNLIKK